MSEAAHDVYEVPGSTEALLNEREKTHGSFIDHASITQGLKIAAKGDGWHRLDQCQKEALEMILHKIGRILAGNPNHDDHWDDIAGYAKLANRLQHKIAQALKR